MNREFENNFLNHFVGTFSINWKDCIDIFQFILQPNIYQCWIALLLHHSMCKKTRTKKDRRTVKFARNEKNSWRNRKDLLKGEKLLEAYLDRHHLLISPTAPVFLSVNFQDTS